MERRLITQSYKSPPDKSPQPAAVDADRSAVPPSFHFGATGAVHVASRSTLRNAATEDGRWFSFFI